MIRTRKKYCIWALTATFGLLSALNLGSLHAADVKWHPGAQQRRVGKVRTETVSVGKYQLTSQGYAVPGWVLIGWSNRRTPPVKTRAVESQVQPLYRLGTAFDFSQDTTLYAVWAIDQNNDGTPDYRVQAGQLPLDPVWIQKRLGKTKSNISVGQLSQALELASEEDTTNEEKKLLESIVSFGNTETCEVMVPRVDIFALSEDTPFSEVLSEIVKIGYSRIPVYRENLDNITGVIYIKDLLPYIEKTDFEWTKVMRKAFFVPENKKLDDLLSEFQEKKIHLAVVVDEYGGTCGIITLEDIMEEIVGSINDEFDDDDVTYSKINDHTYIFEGKTVLKDFYRIVKMDDENILLFDEKRGEAEIEANLRQRHVEIDNMIADKEFERNQKTVEAIKQYQEDLSKAAEKMFECIGSMNIELRMRAHRMCMEMVNEYIAIQNRAMDQMFSRVKEIREIFPEECSERTMMIEDVREQERMIQTRAGELIQIIQKDLDQLGQSLEKIKEQATSMVEKHLSPLRARELSGALQSPNAYEMKRLPE